MRTPRPSRRQLAKHAGTVAAGQAGAGVRNGVIELWWPVFTPASEPGDALAAV
jgi:hypothetical protein